MKQKDQIIEVSKNIHISRVSGSVYNFSGATSSRVDPETKVFSGYEIIKWGGNNLHPYENRKLLAANDNKQNTINMDVDLAAGKGLIFYKDRIIDGKKDIEIISDPELNDWRDESLLYEWFRETIQDGKEFGNSYAHGIMSKDRKKVNKIISLDACECRLAMNKRNIADFIVVADWNSVSKLKKDDYRVIPLIDYRYPYDDIGNGTEFCYHIKENVSGQPHYSLEGWYGTKKWTEIANRIPNFHLAGLDGGYLIRYHIILPASLITWYMGQENPKTKKNFKMSEAREYIRDSIDEVLKGEDKAHNNFYSIIDDKLPNAKGIEIIPLNADLKDDSYDKLFETASNVSSRGHNIHPVLAGNQTTGSLSSGSEILNLYNFHIATKVQRPRLKPLKFLHAVMKYNYESKYREGIRIGVEDTELKTTDSNPSGKENRIS